MDPLVTLIIAATWLLLIPRWVERSRFRLNASQHHALYVASLVALGILLLWTVGASIDAQSLGAASDEIARVNAAYGSMGKFPDLVVATVPKGAAPIAASIAALWGLGTLVCLTRMFRSRRRAARIIARAEPLEDRRVETILRRTLADGGAAPALRILVSDEIASPMIWGPPKTVLVLTPEALAVSRDELRMLAVHERTHLRRRDSLTHHFARWICAAYWFHPMAWQAARRMTQLQEHRADAEVLRQGFRPSDYAQFLLRTARIGSGKPAIGHTFGKSPLGERMRRLLENERDVSVSRPAMLSALLMLTILPAVGLLLGPVLADDLQRDLSLDEVLRPLIVNKLQDYHIAGAAVTVVHGDDVLYTEGFGRAEVFDGRPVDPEKTIFRIGSISKVMTGVAVMQLVDDGRVELDADVNRYLSEELRVQQEFAEPVRVRDLLTHTAGFDQFGYGRHAASADDVQRPGEFLRGNLVRVRPPGEASVYDTYGITLAGHLVESITGLSYEDYLIEYLFKPLEMHRSGIEIPAALADDVAVGYEFRGEWFPQRWEYMNTAPASTINSTVNEMGNFIRMLLAKGEFGERRLLSAESVDAMMVRQFSNHPELAGFGLTFWEDRGAAIDAYAHGGSMTGFGSFLWIAPEHDLGIYVAYNQESGRLARDVIDRVVATLVPDATRTSPKRAPWTEAIDLKRFTGTWVDGMHNHTRRFLGGWAPRPFDLTVDDQGRLLFEGQSARPVGPLLFEREDGLLLAFRENEDGDITYMFVNQTTYERFGADSASP